MEFSLDELKLIDFALYVKKGELSLTSEELQLAKKIADTLEHWGVSHYN